jgi:hypothetical protein
MPPRRRTLLLYSQPRWIRVDGIQIRALLRIVVRIRKGIPVHVVTVHRPRGVMGEMATMLLSVVTFLFGVVVRLT